MAPWLHSDTPARNAAHLTDLGWKVAHSMTHAAGAGHTFTVEGDPGYNTYAVSGSFIDWIYNNQDVLAYLIELR
eukprot:gene3857-4817_t